MGIPSKQIGQSAESNLLWQISKQLQQLAKTMILPTTTSTTTLPQYQSPMFFGTDQATACTELNFISYAQGDGTTQCDSSYLTSPEFSAYLVTSSVYLRNVGDTTLRPYTYIIGSNYVVPAGPCEVCP